MECPECGWGQQCECNESIRRVWVSETDLSPSPEKKVFYKITLGILLCGPMRRYLQKRKFLDMAIKWMESWGIIERDWIIVGSKKDIETIAGDINRWAKKHDLF